MLCWAAGRQREARGLLEETLDCAADAPDVRITGNALTILAGVVLDQGDPARAQVLARQSLDVRRALNDAWTVGVNLEILARSSMRLGSPARAACLFGAAAGLMAGIGRTTKGTLDRQASHERAIDATRRALGEPAFDAAWAVGQAMSLEEAIACAQADQPPPAASTPTGTIGGPGRQPADPLTRREREVAALMARGLTNGQIATELVVSERTVDTHAEHIRTKLDVRSRAEVAAWVARHGLLDVSSVPR
jgi:non-specific serine/threonine protein kinase